MLSLRKLCAVVQFHFDPGFKIIGNYSEERMHFGDLGSLYQLFYPVQGREGFCTSTVTAREVDQRYFVWKLEDFLSG